MQGRSGVQGNRAMQPMHIDRRGSGSRVRAAGKWCREIWSRVVRKVKRGFIEGDMVGDNNTS